MLPKGAGAQNPAQHLRRRSRCRPCTRLHHGFRAITPRSQTRRDAVRPSQAHPAAWSPPVARPTWCARPVHARSYRTESTPARQTARPTTTSARCVCRLTVTGVSATASKPPPPMERVATDGFKNSLQPPRSSDRRLLQQNLPKADESACTATVASPRLVGRRLPTQMGFHATRGSVHDDKLISPCNAAH